MSSFSTSVDRCKINQFRNPPSSTDVLRQLLDRAVRHAGHAGQQTLSRAFSKTLRQATPTMASMAAHDDFENTMPSETRTL